VTGLERDPRERMRFRVAREVDRGKRAITNLVAVDFNSGRSLIECDLGTGRTHQIRVHLSFLGFPLLGDTLYGGSISERLWLHAHQLTLTHPRSGERMSFRAPWPSKDLETLTQQWNLHPKNLFR
jgi:23S rRNA pseudouridine1911/1915/1917 synthase